MLCAAGSSYGALYSSPESLELAPPCSPARSCCIFTARSSSISSSRRSFRAAESSRSSFICLCSVCARSLCTPQITSAVMVSSLAPHASSHAIADPRGVAGRLPLPVNGRLPKPLDGRNNAEAGRDACRPVVVVDGRRELDGLEPPSSLSLSLDAVHALSSGHAVDGRAPPASPPLRTERPSADTSYTLPTSAYLMPSSTIRSSCLRFRTSSRPASPLSLLGDAIPPKSCGSELEPSIVSFPSSALWIPQLRNDGEARPASSSTLVGSSSNSCTC
mmetsp:Transcript_45176/g.112330  ORF Transcript_45176/g.112330 Transcript_45176/m.112330 type:complete len:275 (-) Transcript_45176:878-1702(-)